MDPEEEKMWREGKEYAMAHAREFFLEHQEQFLSLVSEYADFRAEELLGLLREKFWARMWSPKGKAE